MNWPPDSLPRTRLDHALHRRMLGCLERNFHSALELSRRVESEPVRRIVVTAALTLRLGCGDRLGPLLRLFVSIELADQRVDASRQLGQEGDLVSSASIAFSNDDRVDKNRDDEALRIIELCNAAKLRKRFAPCRKRVRERFGPSNAPRHSPISLDLGKNMPLAEIGKWTPALQRSVSALTADNEVKMCRSEGRRSTAMPCIRTSANRKAHFLECVGMHQHAYGSKDD